MRPPNAPAPELPLLRSGEDPFETLEGDHAHRPSDALLYAGALVDHFQVVQRIGRGGMGEVYLARDTVLGRRVALKVIHGTHLRSPEARERFVAEARTTARFNHPHIVTVYAIGEYRSCPYMALEYLEGQTLRERMLEERLNVRTGMRLGRAIAEALAEAHRHNVLHRDLKPENILLPRDGRLRVVDFGLAMVGALWSKPDPNAQSATSAPATSGTSPEFNHLSTLVGTPAYMAPEQLSPGAIGSAVDLWALGIILYELITGHHPSRQASVEAQCAWLARHDPVESILEHVEAPGELADLVSSCLDREPTRRPSAAMVSERLQWMIERGRGHHSDEQSPFRGLLPFGERHVDFFYGRDPEIAALLERLREQPVLPIVGASGTGKSSLVQAGIIPRLREQGPWKVLSMRPGRSPFLALAARLLGESGSSRSIFTTPIALEAQESLPENDPPDDTFDATWAERRDRLARELFDEPARLSLHLHQLAAEERSRALLYVDQLEELHTLVDDQQVRQRFMNALSLAADDPHSPVRVVFTLRDDFLSRLALGTIAREVMSRVFVLQRPEREALVEMLVRPIEAAGYRIDEPLLVTEMVSAVEEEPAGLPLLQFAARMLWDRRDRQRRLLCRSTYESMGGVGGALARHADGVLEGLGEPLRRTARDLMLKLVTPDQTRRSLSRAEALEGLEPTASEVLDRLIEARLIAVRRAIDDSKAETGLELAHESLVHTWKQLKRWIEESQEDLVFLSQTSQAASLWEARGRREDELWQLEALYDAERMLARCSMPIPSRVSSFLDMGRRLAERRGRLRRRLLLASGALLLLVTAVAAVAATLSARQETEALRRWAKGEEESAAIALERGAVQEARARVRGAMEQLDSPRSRALWGKLKQEPLLWEKNFAAGRGVGVAISPDGRSIACSMENTLVLIDVKTQVMRTFKQDIATDRVLAFSPDGRFVYAFNAQGRMILRRVSDGTIAPLKDSGPTHAWDFSGDGRWLVLGQADTLGIWEPGTDGPPRVLHGSVHATEAHFSPDGRLLAGIYKDGTIRIWDFATGAILHSFQGHPGRGDCVTFSLDGRWLASSGRDAAVRIWEVASGQLYRTFKVRSELFLKFRPDGQLLGWSYPPGEVQLYRWDIHSEVTHEERFESTAAVSHRSFDPEGRLLALGGKDGAVHLWDIDTGAKRLSLNGHKALISAIAFGPDGDYLVSRSEGGMLRFWAIGASMKRAEGVGAGGFFDAVAVNGDGTRIAAGRTDFSIHLWTPASPLPERVLRGHSGTIVGLAFSPDGRLLASSAMDETIRIWAIESGTLRHVLEAGPGPRHPFFQPDGRLLAVGGANDALRAWDPERGILMWKLRMPGTSSGFLFSPDGPLLASWGEAGLDIWNYAKGTLERRLTRGAAFDITFPPAGPRLATADGTTIRVVDALSGIERWRFDAPGAAVDDLLLTPDGNYLISSDGHALMRWDIRTGQKQLLKRLDSRAWFMGSAAGGRFVLEEENRKVSLWDAVTGGVNGTHAAPGAMLIRASSDGSHLVTVAPDEASINYMNFQTGRPVWRATALLRSPPWLLSHRGWLDLRAAPDVAADLTTVSKASPPSSPSAGVTPSVTRWGRAIEQNARHVSESDGSLLCVLTWDDALEIWDRSADTRLYREAIAGLEQVVATSVGCAILASRQAKLFGRDGVGKLLTSEGRSIGWSGDEVLVGTDTEIFTFDAQGKPRACFDVGRVPSAMLRLPDRLVVGYTEGGLEVRSTADPRAPVLELVDALPGTVTTLGAGPLETLMIGYKNGLVEHRSLEDGARLDAFQLNGPVVHLVVADQKLYAASERGDHRTVDLEPFHRERCDLLHEVWSEVDVIWENGRSVHRPPPDRHACAEP